MSSGRPENTSARGSRSADETPSAVETTATAEAADERRRVDDHDHVAGDVSNSQPPVLTIVHMPSDNDGGETVSSSGSGPPSPVPPARAASRPPPVAAQVTGKGILVHNNKKSANTNRVSFVTSGSPPSPSSQSQSTTLSPSMKRSTKKKQCFQEPDHQNDHHDHQNHQRRRSDDELLPSAPYHARTGRRLTGFGIKSYLHEFYDDPEDVDQDPFQNDDFKYCVEPEIRWRAHCTGVYAVLGLAVMTIGAAAMAAGHLIPARNPIVGRTATMEVIDPWAVAYNQNLASCRYVGSVVFAVGVVFTVVRFWASVIRGDEGLVADRKLLIGTDDVRQAVNRQPTVRIPITGSVQNVQPDLRTINLRSSRDCS